MVTLGLELSGNNKTRRPLSSAYSVMPSTVTTFFGSAAEEAEVPATVVTSDSVTRRRSFLMARILCRAVDNFKR